MITRQQDVDHNELPYYIGCIFDTRNALSASHSVTKAQPKAWSFATVWLGGCVRIAMAF